MLNISSFDKSNLRTLRQAMEEDMKMLGEKYGLSFKLGAARYNSNLATFKLEMGVITGDGKVFDKFEEEYKMYCGRYGLKMSDFGKMFQTMIKGNNRNFTIVGINHRAHRMPILAKCLEDQKNYKFSSEFILMALKNTVSSCVYGP